MVLKNLLKNKKGATMLEASIVLSILLVSVTIGVDLVRVAYFSAVLEYEIVKAQRLANIESNSNRTGFGNVYRGDLTYGCNVAGVDYADCGGAAVNCDSRKRACAYRQYLRNTITQRALSKELNSANWKNYFFIYYAGAPNENVMDAGRPGELMVTDLRVPMELISPLELFIGGGTITIRGSSIGRNEY